MSLREDLKAFADGELDIQRSEEMRLALERDPILLKGAHRDSGDFCHDQSFGGGVDADRPDGNAGSGRQGTPTSQNEWGYRLALGGGVLVTAGLAAALLFPIFAQAKFAAEEYAAPKL